MVRTLRITALALFLTLFVSAAFSAPQRKRDKVDYAGDVTFALKEIEKQCRPLLRLKEVDWKKVTKEYTKRAKKLKTNEDYFILLAELIGRVEDGHAYVIWPETSPKLSLPEDWTTERTGCGMFWCTIEGDLYVKNVWNSAKDAGVEAGMKILKVDGKKPNDWLEGRIAELRKRQSFSTEHQARFFACHWGLDAPKGTRIKLELQGVDGKKTKRTVTYIKANSTAWGPAYAPEGTTQPEGTKNVYVAKTAEGYGWIQIRRCKSSLPSEIDAALAELGNVPGLILDFRGNSGGSFDHVDFMGRFVPKEHELKFNKRYSSAGRTPYGGPIVCIVDATVRSAGETAAAIFREDGRAYTIGESPTAGMSATKTTIELPSGLASLYVATGSNMSRSNEGRGLEGIGAIPHEIVSFKPEDLAAEKDTLILRAAALLADYPQKEVPYNPSDFDWEAP